LDGDAGLKRFQEKFYDILLLDWMLPKMSGVQLCQKVRETREAPIIMLTAKAQIEDKSEGFSCGADDYLVKPFDLEELVMRIKAIMKRFDEPEKIVYHDIEYFPEQRKFLKAGIEQKLSNKEFLILSYLFEYKGQVLSRADILDQVWGEDLFENDDKLDVYISTLRKKMGKDIIETVKGVGYKIE
jgi:DNA-binding response OmpR family regulator